MKAAISYIRLSSEEQADSGLGLFHFGVQCSRASLIFVHDPPLDTA
jgi:hypothetical protein